VRFFLTLSKSYLSEYSPVGLDRKSYDHSGRVMFLTKLNESGYAIKNVQMLLWCNSFWITNFK
ncbi:uncharacterized protein METZ01_LOCUS407918, partial [marine metagenome]